MPRMFLIPLGIMFLVSTALNILRSYLRQVFRPGGW